MDAGYLLKFIADEDGSHFYNKALQDTWAVLPRGADDISNAIDELHNPTGERKHNSPTGLR